MGNLVELGDRAHPELTQLLRGDKAMNAKLCYYAACWASLMLTSPTEPLWMDWLEKVIGRFGRSWPEDAWLIDKYLRPLYTHHVLSREELGNGLNDPWHFWQFMHDGDDALPHVHRRQMCDNTLNPPFKIGQVFRHRRYGWLGVITSWHEEGLLPGRRLARTFYFMCLATVGPEPHLVSAHNIELVFDPTLVVSDVLPLAGKYFKRFDSETYRFISNIRDEYPDD